LRDIIGIPCVRVQLTLCFLLFYRCIVPYYHYSPHCSRLHLMQSATAGPGRATRARVLRGIRIHGSRTQTRVGAERGGGASAGSVLDWRSIPRPQQARGAVASYHASGTPREGYWACSRSNVPGGLGRHGVPRGCSSPHLRQQPGSRGPVSPLGLPSHGPPSTRRSTSRRGGEVTSLPSWLQIR
jgi:hypothetical protein